MHIKLPIDGSAHNDYNGSNCHNTQINVWGFQFLVSATKSVVQLDFFVFVCILTRVITNRPFVDFSH